MGASTERKLEILWERVDRLEKRVTELTENEQNLRDKFPGFDLTEAIMAIQSRLSRIEKVLSIEPEKTA